MTDTDKFRKTLNSFIVQRERMEPNSLKRINPTVIGCPRALRMELSALIFTDRHGAGEIEIRADLIMI